MEVEARRDWWEGKDEELLHPPRHIIPKFKDDGGKDGEIRSQRAIETALNMGL